MMYLEKSDQLILCFVEPNTCYTITAISKGTGLTYSHAVKRLGYMCSIGLMNSEKVSRDRIITLTSVGAEFHDALSKIISKLIELDKVLIKPDI